MKTSATAAAPGRSPPPIARSRISEPSICPRVPPTIRGVT